MDIDEARAFIRSHHRGVLATVRGDGRPQMTAVSVALDEEGRPAISTREAAYKVRNIRRDPHVSLFVVSEDFWQWVQVDGTASVLSLPDAMEPLVAYYRAVGGEHPDWDDYRTAMTRQGKSLLRVTIERWGPIATGGFPPELTAS
jgi:PPOX class probable F420-dependent enzyme